MEQVYTKVLPSDKGSDRRAGLAPCTSIGRPVRCA